MAPLALGSQDDSLLLQSELHCNIDGPYGSVGMDPKALILISGEAHELELLQTTSISKEMPVSHAVSCMANGAAMVVCF